MLDKTINCCCYPFNAVLSFTNTASACFETPADGVPQLQFAGNWGAPTIVPVSITGDIATVRQFDLYGLGDFVDMRNTPNAWHIASPTLFPPILNDGIWSFFGQPNSNCINRDRSIKNYPAWHKWNMWRSDGRPAKQPTLSFVLANEHYKHQLFGQGHVCLNSEDMVDVSMSPESFLDTLRGHGTPGNTFANRLNHYAANVRGTDQYWKSMGSDFRATAFCHSHFHKRQPNMFHTLSHSEFNDPHLRLLVARYVAVVEDNPELKHTIMSDKRAWAKSIHSYKTVVTHYFACKMELWLLFFVSPVYGLEHVNGVHDFGSSRGAIHAHMLGYLVGDTNDTIDAILENWAEKAYFESVFCDAAVDNATDDDSDLVSSAKATLAEQLERFKQEASSQLDAIFTSEYGITAVHPGQAPSEMAKPAGRAAMGYHSVHHGMQTRREVLATNEIKSFKF
jgi:hypothetical protein